ncbi:sodium/potassium-transporting ATPase subunit beta-1b [Maylandia zebra]|uniref:Sodium/potassium-transporting ATPase subunit beta n=4 Tax=Haplochromini TaxID=319058 RepID=A0A3B4H183_9CICH|nr:sodium/potassium-transporting ATPase subunit beta-233 [Maylandia zebra]XP_005748118.1 PREDICTED: sodium/potassium-transporting ATPase subunit beta-233-like [Pundamilia nyererei]XP_005938785.1 sodium/potassium-transporting ATPase subunit beta-1b [Haplochromis burtoni]XP_026015122.1 sodium/potassium-transporting ATPase subunit beta-233-like [Astatotilapia calliptera]XP_039870746.1 sodium/potassium-transporting ATPase subunit beta-1b [Simochromis diagramma]
MPSDKKDDGGWKKFLWNSETGELLGRTGGSWFKITLFYVIFYGCLAGIFIGTIQAMLLTLSEYKPTWQDRVAPPGLTHTPRSDKAEMAFNPRAVETFLPHTKALREFLDKYDESKQKDQMKFEDCGDQPADYKNRGDLDSDVGVRKACRFSRALLGPCSGLEDTEFGFKEGKPCLIVKLNRIVNYRPRPPTSNESIPEEAQPKVQPNVIPIYCTSKKEEDADKIGEIKYYGIGEGFPLQYYPYYGKKLHPQYLQPLVALQFTNLTRNTDLRIECKVFGDNIDYSEKDRYQGRFEIKIQVEES